MTARPLTAPMQRALVAMLKGPLTRRSDLNGGDGWIAQDRSFHALVVVRNLHQRGLVLPPTKLVALPIAGRREAQRIEKIAPKEHNAA